MAWSPHVDAAPTLGCFRRKPEGMAAALGGAHHVLDPVAEEDGPDPVLLPGAGETLGPVVVLPSALAELSLTLWLLVKGLEVRRRTEHVPALV